MPRIRLSTTEFIIRANRIHGNVYDYSNTVYVCSNHKVKIVCLTHGIFEQTPRSHLSGSGCKECGQIRKRKGKETFIKEARIIHGDKYDYSHVDYIINNRKVMIVCPEHGEFYQTPDAHVNKKHGCRKCGNLTGGGVGRYVVRMEDNNESFVKVGIISLPLNERFGSQKKYSFTPLLVKEMILKDAYDYEQTILDRFHAYKYLPRKYFYGRTECFTNDILEVLNV